MGSIFNGVMLVSSVVPPKAEDTTVLMVWDFAVFFRMFSKK